MTIHPFDDGNGRIARAIADLAARASRKHRAARFWEPSAPLVINERQRAILNRLLDGVTGHLTTMKWATLAKCSHDMALRDIQGLIDLGLPEEGRGRSTSYSLNDGQAADSTQIAETGSR